MNTDNTKMVFGHGPAGYNKPEVATREPRWVHLNGKTLECTNGKHKHVIVLVGNRWYSQGAEPKELATAALHVAT